MGNQSSNSHDIYTRRVSSVAGARPGMAKDQLIFIIICAVAVTVAAIALIHSFSGGPKTSPGIWQCVDENCGHEFKKAAFPPVKCPKCGGEAVQLIYRDCPACKKKVLYCRVHTEAPPEGAAGPAGVAPELGMMQRKSLQYWVKQPDGTFAWSPWFLAGSPQAMQMESNMVCSKCGASMSNLPPPARRR